MTTVLYRFFDAGDVLLYVGITDAFARRRYTHGASAWEFLTARESFEYYPSRENARSAENHAIRTESPKYNLHASPDVVAALVSLAKVRGERGRREPSGADFDVWLAAYGRAQYRRRRAAIRAVEGWHDEVVHDPRWRAG